MLRWNFDVEHVDVILGHNVEYNGWMSRLPMLVLECSKGGHLERGHAKKDWRVAFWGGKSGWNWLKFSWKNPDPWPGTKLIDDNRDMKARDSCILWDQWSGLHSLAPSKTRTHSLATKTSDLDPTVVDTFCLPVKLSPRRSLLAASRNVATSQPGHGVFACLLIAPEGLGSESRWEWRARGSGFFHENFSQFHPLLPPQKATFQSFLAWPPLQVASFWAF